MSTPNDDPHPRNVAFELQSLLLVADHVEAFLIGVARSAAGVVTRAQSCGVTVQASHGSRMLGATSDDFARRMDEIQYAVDDGPCLHCLRSGATVVVADIGTDSRWPAFAQRGRQEGAGASMSVPLRVNDESIGALNLYSRHAHGLDDVDQARAAQFAHEAAGAVKLAIELTERADRGRHLERALTSRSTIDQAIGVIMGLHRVSAEEAFDALRRRSQNSNIKLREVAQAVLDEATTN